VGQSSKTAEIWRWGRKSENPHFFANDELWSSYGDTFGKPSGRAQDTKILWAKVQEKWRYSDGGENQKTPTFSKLMNSGPVMVTLLESSRAGLHDPKILWAKVQKRRRYGDGGKIGKTPLSGN